MGAKGMWAVNASALAMLIVVNLALSMTGEALWTLLGILALAGTLFFCHRQGAKLGHGACGISGTVESARKAGTGSTRNWMKSTLPRRGVPPPACGACCSRR